MRVLDRVFIVSFLALFLSITCFGQDVKVHWATGTDFSKFKTYKWQRAEKANYQDAVVDRILKKTIGEQLTAKGMTESDSDSADVYVIYQMAVGEDAEWSTFNTGVDWYTGANNLAGFGGATTNATTIIRKGWLMIDIYHTADKKLVWQANAVKTLGKGTDPQKMESNARKAMSKVFKNYPPHEK